MSVQALAVAMSMAIAPSNPAVSVTTGGPAIFVAPSSGTQEVGAAPALSSSADLDLHIAAHGSANPPVGRPAAQPHAQPTAAASAEIGTPPALPMALVTPVVSDLDIRVLSTQALGTENPQNAPTLEGAGPPFSLDGADPHLAEPAAPAPSYGLNDIVVTGDRRNARSDPLEKLNEVSFKATEAVDKALVGPVSRAYAHVLPKQVRNGLRNFLNNLDEPVAFLNLLLEHKLGKAVETLGRFAINSTAGVVGVFDIAKRRPFRLPRRSIGFADTLGFYGVKPGPFLYLPLIGPTSLRDLIGGAIDGFVLPTLFRKPFNRISFTLPATVLREFDSRNEFDEELEKLRQTADPYAASREFYLRKRSTQIDELRAKRGGPLSATSKLTNPALDPLLTPMSQPTAPTPASRHGVMTLPGMSGRKP